MPGDAVADRRSTALWWLLQMVFLPFGIPLLSELMHAHPAPLHLIVSLVGAAVFVGLYAWTTWQNARGLASATPGTTYEPPGEVALWWPIGALALGAWLLTGFNGPVWGSLFIFTAAAASARLPLRQAFFALGAIAVLIVIGGARLGMAPGDIIEGLLTLGVTGAATCSVVQAVRTAQRWRVQREELARHAAIAEERLRIARDLHDLLGHNLSVIALKSELARRLLSVAPERAEAEVADVERVARQALQEVREAVAGYRQPTLAVELAGARELLAAAGIHYRFERSGFAGDEHASLALPPAVDSALGWAVREGITNMLRHSSASTCTVRLTRDEHDVSLELVNDGTISSASDCASPPRGGVPAVMTGNGLRGLEERVRSAGGALQVAGLPGGSFRLAMRMPLAQATASTPPRLDARTGPLGQVELRVAEPAQEPGALLHEEELP